MENEEEPGLETIRSGDVGLVANRFGQPSERSVLFLHGGGQTRHSWGRTAATLAERGWCAWTLDMRGHGQSDWSPHGDYSLSAFADDLVPVVDAMGSKPAIVGASLGGVAGLLALGQRSPGLGSGLVLVDIVPEVNTAGTDRIKAFMAERMNEGFASLQEAADAVAAYSSHRKRPPDPEGLRKNLRERDGRWYWHWDPAFVNGMSKGPSEVFQGQMLTQCAQSLKVPLMLVRGQMSDVVDEAGAQALLDAVPTCEYADVSGAGHMVAGDRNDRFNTAIIDFLDRL